MGETILLNFLDPLYILGTAEARKLKFCVHVYGEAVQPKICKSRSKEVGLGYMLARGSATGGLAACCNSDVAAIVSVATTPVLLTVNRLGQRRGQRTQSTKTGGPRRSN